MLRGMGGSGLQFCLRLFMLGILRLHHQRGAYRHLGEADWVKRNAQAMWPIRAVELKELSAARRRRLLRRIGHRVVPIRNAANKKRVIAFHRRPMRGGSEKMNQEEFD